MRGPLPAASVLIVAVVACAVYANLSFRVMDPADYRFFPPFRPHHDANRNFELGGENALPTGGCMR